MTGLKKVVKLLIMLFVLGAVSGCAGMDGNTFAEGVTFRKVGGFTDRYGQAKIRLIVYSGEAKEGNIRLYAEKLGCGMLYAYYYPDTTDMNDIPVQQLEYARNFVEARDLLFKGEGAGRWSFASQCLGMIPTVTDCVELPISTNCR